jgi:multiple sugar transport system ATP-binding protein
MARVSIRNLSKIYRGDKGVEVRAVKDLSVEIAGREFLVLAGPPGCGKSTVLRMIAGLEKSSNGDIYIGEKRVNDLAPKDRDIAMVFEDGALYPHISVYDNLAFGLKLRKYSKSEIKRRVLDTASIVRIEGFLEKKPKELSLTQRQRVAIGRAIVRQPKVFLFDDPLSTLDAKMRAQLRSEITKLHQRLEATIIYATQDSIEAMTLADRIVVMNQGMVQQTGAPLVLYREPANLFIAGFFGSPPMNLIHGTLKLERDRIRFCEIEGGTIEATFTATERTAAKELIGKAVILGVRPEDIEVAKFSPNERKTAAPALRALVEIVEPMGAATNLHLQTGAHTLVCRTQQMLDRHEAGHRLQFEIDVSKAHLFDPVSTNRLG